MASSPWPDSGRWSTAMTGTLALFAALTPAAAAVESCEVKMSAPTCWVSRSLTWLTCWFELLFAEVTTSL